MIDNLSVLFSSDIPYPRQYSIADTQKYAFLFNLRYFIFTIYFVQQIVLEQLVKATSERICVQQNWIRTAYPITPLPPHYEPIQSEI